LRNPAPRVCPTIELLPAELVVSILRSAKGTHIIQSKVVDSPRKPTSAHDLNDLRG
jgi:hypothetical protein